MESFFICLSQVLTICANFGLSSATEVLAYQGSNNKLMIPLAQDYSEGELSPEKFVIKFKEDEQVYTESGQ